MDVFCIGNFYICYIQGGTFSNFIYDSYDFFQNIDYMCENYNNFESNLFFIENYIILELFYSKLKKNFVRNRF